MDDEELDPRALDYKPTESSGGLRDLGDEDESLKRWKESLGVVDHDGEPKLTVISVFCRSSTTPTKEIEVQVDGKDDQTRLKEPVTIKKDTDFSIGIRFKLSGDFMKLRYNQRINNRGSRFNRDLLDSEFGKDIGLFAPSAQTHEATLRTLQMPFVWCGHNEVTVVTTIIDEKSNVLAEWALCLRVKDDWD